jgi:hypothetical protein
MDSTEIPVYGEQEQSAYNGHFESTCYYPLLLFNGEGDCLAGKLRPGNVHSAEDWEEVLLPEIERQEGMGKEVVFRADAAFAKPEVYEATEERGVCDSASSERRVMRVWDMGFFMSFAWPLIVPYFVCIQNAGHQALASGASPPGNRVRQCLSSCICSRQIALRELRDLNAAS